MAKSKNSNADETTLKLIEEVKRRRLEISKAERSTWLTNSSFAYVEGSSNTVNIKVVADLKQLISIAAFLKGQEANYKAAATELGVESPPVFTWGGFSLSDWMEDLKTRIAKIQLESKRQKLAALEARLDAVISPELKREMELAKIAEELDN
jgi:hypothetical protein